MRNKEIREAIKASGFKYWQVAEVIGISRYTFSEWLRYELTGERREKVEKAIEKLKGARSQ